MKKRLMYFGCLRDKGHALYDNWGQSERNIKHDGFNANILKFLDATFAPDTTPYQDVGKYQVSIVPPAIIAAWWDRSLDHRYGSNSVLIGFGYESAEQMIDDAMAIYPTVMNRQPRPIPIIKN